ncbi:Nucleolar protein 12 [Penicillium riverlandense]|uniref:Nucleolar protein 12 n=1 Tax=Penicillium riverlandense TaxID=1903569 RepID=UPI002548BBB9|nr:Nucleolar protein 12 [Penicillium riverlandense]KAJ5825765.1 Nucleolar protein 12 [Penicillium riverlandense]
MGKSKSKSKSESTKTDASSTLPFLGASTSLDPTLSSLFEKSAGPVKAPVIPESFTIFKAKQREDADLDQDEEQQQSADSDDEVMEDASDANESESADEENSAEPQGRKRKRAGAEEDLEESYMRRIAKEEQKADEKRKEEQAKRIKKVDQDSKEAGEDVEGSEQSDEEAVSEAGEDDEDLSPAPVHESVAKSTSEVEKSNRTVFLGNVSTEAIKSKSAKKTLLRHLASFCASLPESSGPHKVESIRFRSVPFSSGGGLPKRASYAKMEILDETTPSTNAYAVYTTTQAARKAPAALNGTVVLDRHLRVDSIAHPAEIDNKRCVFVGNLDFVDKEVEDAEPGKKKKTRAAADVEEGLWRTFNAHTGEKDKKKTGKGSVEFVRVIRDRSTRVGKGFAYVQFYDGNGVEAALLLNEKKFPPMLPRKLRVTRARKMAKKRDGNNNDGGERKMGKAQKTMQGRAGKLLGRSAAHQMKTDGKGSIAANGFVFEGHRATEGSASVKMKTKSRGSKGKPKNRSSKRAAAYRAAGGKKP